MHERLAEMKRAYEAIPVPELHPMIDALCRASDRGGTFGGRWWSRRLHTDHLCRQHQRHARRGREPRGRPRVGAGRQGADGRLSAGGTGATARVDIAQITGLANQELEDAINAELRTDGQALIDKFERDVAELKERLGEDARFP